ncbi:hypothetical protein Patl1_11499 [Pistacia atlantica]|uniref:Uncharacterized protein n=1 Tax=Pistacia atlantica TaxID=434234 RepID=A0ACC1A8M5_9ROSI|nr:hypothetical protein Patl1_11499 [Pistacia atlantica]
MVSFVLDLFGKNKCIFLLFAFLLSASSFVMIVYNRIMGRTKNLKQKLQSARQLEMVEIVFSIVQLVATFVHLILAAVGIKNNYNLSIFPLAFAIVLVAFVFEKEDEEFTHGDDQGMNLNKF